MNVWPVQDAKARFSEMLDTCIADGPQIVTRRGTETAVLVPIQEWTRLNQSSKPTLKELLLSKTGPFDLEIPQRGTARRRKPEAF
jgi:antitoxin Phd